MKKTLLLLLLLIPMAFAQPVEVFMTNVPSLPELPSGVQVLMDIEVEGTIGVEVTELSYVHRLSSRANESLTVYLEYNPNSEPEVLEVTVDGESVEPSVVSKTPFSSSYRVPLSIAEEEVTVRSHLKYETRPQGGRGLWRDQFSFNNPVNIAPLAGPTFARSLEGEIRLPEDARQVQCSNCDYNADEHLVRVSLANTPPYISFNFQVKKQPPVKAGAVYVLMLLAIFGYVIKERAKRG